MDRDTTPPGKAAKRAQSPSPPSSSRTSGPNHDSDVRRSHATAPPSFMSVGGGSTSASAAALVSMLENDSGYGGSISEDGPGRVALSPAWQLSAEDRPTPSHSPARGAQSPTEVENDRRLLASHVHQLTYNSNRVTLGRAISRTVDLLKGLQDMNAHWPAHYPSVQRPSTTPNSQRSDPRPGLIHTQSTATEIQKQSARHEPPRPSSLKRSLTVANTDDSGGAESSAAAERRAIPEPRLITSQIVEDFSVLKIDLKLGALSQTELVHSLEKSSIASLLDGKISESVRHLLSLRDRIEDTSSKVLVTGDLNAGKSTFCNALLRRKVLPEDQQPCTSIFCEVLDARANGGFEEAHAVPKGLQYDRNDESTYDVYSLAELEKVVIDNERYNQAKIYLKDVRAIDESLLSNGVVDISIIDAPGLNSDSLKTTAVFARQEEIDVVVFVVSAANHFTLSAKEFIWNAAREKAYIFIVVNGFDNIRDQERCKRTILEQVASLSPRTFKESAELVHFVSSNAIPVAPSSSGSSGTGPPGDPPEDHDPDDDDEPKGKHGEEGDPPITNKGKEKEKLKDFDELEQALRRFVLEKRARSKLAPAKTYLLNVLGDVNTLATVNRDVAASELERVSRELEELEPVYEQSKKARAEVSEEIDHTIEETCTSIYSYTRSALSNTISRIAQEDLGVPYPGIFNAFEYAEDIKNAMLEQVTTTVKSSEARARDQTVQGVSNIKALGLLHLGDEYTDMSFRSDIMFRRKRDALARQVHIQVDVWDFFDVSSMLQRQEKVAGTGMAMTVVGVVGGRMIGGIGWMDGAIGAARVLGAQGVRRLIIPGVVAIVVAVAGYALTSIPNALPRRLATKLSDCLSELDYTHANAARISNEVRKVLRFPADGLRVGLQRSIEKIDQQRGDTITIRRESEVARKYFSNLLREGEALRGGVAGVDV